MKTDKELVPEVRGYLNNRIEFIACRVTALGTEDRGNTLPKSHLFQYVAGAEGATQVALSLVCGSDNPNDEKALDQWVGVDFATFMSSPIFQSSEVELDKSMLRIVISLDTMFKNVLGTPVKELAYRALSEMMKTVVPHNPVGD